MGSGHWSDGIAGRSAAPTASCTLFTAESLAEAGLARPSADAAASTAEMTTMDATRRRRTRDRARQRWYARERRRRFARFLGFTPGAPGSPRPDPSGSPRATALGYLNSKTH